MIKTPFIVKDEVSDILTVYISVSSSWCFQYMLLWLGQNVRVSGLGHGGTGPPSCLNDTKLWGQNVSPCQHQLNSFKVTLWFNGDAFFKTASFLPLATAPSQSLSPTLAVHLTFSSGSTRRGCLRYKSIANEASAQTRAGPDCFTCRPVWKAGRWRKTVLYI